MRKRGLITAAIMYTVHETAITLTELIKEFTDSEALLGQLQETVERLLLNNQEGDSSAEEI